MYFMFTLTHGTDLNSEQQYGAAVEFNDTTSQPHRNLHTEHGSS